MLFRYRSSFSLFLLYHLSAYSVYKLLNVSRQTSLFRMQNKHCTFIPITKSAGEFKAACLWLAAWPRWGAKTVNFFRGRKLKVYFCANYLYSNDLTGYVDLLDFNETWTKSLSRISVPKCVRLLRKSKYFSRDVPLSNSSQKNSYWTTLHGIS